MNGKIKRKGKNKFGIFVIVIGEDGISYYGDNRNIEQQILESIKVNDAVEFEHILSHRGNPTVMSLKLSVMKEVQNKGFTNNDIINDLSKEKLDSIEDRIQEILDLNGFFLCSLFPSFLRDFGIEDYHIYASSIKAFINKYFAMKFIVKTNICINDKFYPNVILRINSQVEDDGINSSNLEENNYGLLNKLFDLEDWSGYLTSPKFCQATPYTLPITLIEKGITCASKILNGEKADYYTLSLFQRELIICRTTRDFIKKWKKETTYNEKIFESCSKCAICELSLPHDNSIVIKLLNALGTDTKPNNSFSSLITRFDLCKNELMPYLYVIKLFASKSKKSTEQCISEYCHFIKNLNSFNTQIIQKRIPMNAQIAIFKRFIWVAYNNIEGNEFSNSLRTNLLSVFFDLNASNCISDVLRIIDQKKETPEWILVDFLENNIWIESDIEAMFNKSINLKLIEKSIATIWNRFSKSKQLPIEFMNVLSWILKYGGNRVLDEIIRITCTSAYTKKEKQLALLNSLSKVSQQLERNEAFYNLGSYIANFVYPDFSSDDLSEIDKIISEWSDKSELYFSARVEKCSPLSKETEKDFVGLFDVFSMNQKNIKELQKIYGFWYIEQHDLTLYTDDQFIDTLKNIYNHDCYYAFQLAFEKYAVAHSNIETLHDMYIDSLIKLNEYGKVIRFAYECEDIGQELRKSYIAKALGGNFTKYGFSQSGLLIFDDNFTVQESIDILNQQFTTNNYSLILSLIVLYTHNDELIKSVYLYSIFSKHAEMGYTRLYSQFRKKYGLFFRKVHNHYDVIQIAFNSLPMQSLLDFLRWASKIDIPDYPDYIPEHSMFIFFDNLLKDIDNPNTWKRNFNHIIESENKRKINSWLICVCGMIMMHKFNMPNSLIIRSAFENVMDDVSSEKPKNLLYYLYQYIEENNDTAICEKLVKLLRDHDARVQLLDNNPWCRQGFDKTGSFVAFCKEMLRETGNIIYSDIITNIKEDIAGKELLEIANYTRSKNFMFKKICNYYMESSEIEEARELLNLDLWQNSTYQEKEVYRVLKLVFDDNLFLLAEYPVFFDNEEDVLRFKQDCVKIISEYPDSSAFLKFISECSDLKHKFTVFSFILGIFYIEDIYHTYYFSYNYLIDKQLIDIYLCYLKKCFEAQLVYNPSYIFEYKLWRYLKILIIDIIKDDTKDDSSLIQLMKQNGYYERMISEGYNDFKNLIQKLLLINELNTDEKKSMFFGLICCDFTHCSDIKNSFLFKLSNTSVIILKQVLNYLNYRDVNEKFYNQFIPELNKENVEGIISLANILSDSLALSFKEWFYRSKDRTYPEFFADLTINSNAPNKSGGNICVERMLSLDEEMYNDNCTFINAVVASKQLPGKVFDRMRISVIGRAKGNFSKRFLSLAQYLYEIGYQMAISQFNYLIALQLCVRKEQSNLIAFLDKIGTEFLNEVPADWRVDTDNILNYAHSNDINIKFKPNGTFYYSESYLLDPKGFSFIKILCDYYKEINNSRNIIGNLKSISDENLDINERIINGVRYFDSHKIDDDNITEAVNLGFLAISNEATDIPTNLKLSVLIDLYRQRNCLSQVPKEKIFEGLYKIYRDFSIDVWLDNYTEICEIISLSNNPSEIEEIQILCTQILQKCPEFQKDANDRATEIIYKQIKNITYIGRSAYVSAIKSAALRRKKIIEDNVRLTISIENVNNELQDGYVYFQLCNNGNVTVNLQDECDITLEITLKDERISRYNVSVSDIGELRAGWITGCRQSIKELNEFCEIGDILDVIVKVNVNKKLITRIATQLKYTKPVTIKCKPLNHYDVGYAAGESSDNRIYGRTEEQTDIENAITHKGGKVVIYGPSRIGKTSLLNWIRLDLSAKQAKDKNVITLLFGGEKNGKNRDYTEYFYKLNHSKIHYEWEDISEINSALSEYLLIDTIKYGLSDDELEKANFEFTVNVEGKASLIDNICEITKLEKSIVYRYKKIDEILKKFNCELWILFDEFQKVVEKWKSITEEDTVEFIRVCNRIDKHDISSIKLIFCGSDELLRQMVLEKENSIWRKNILNTASKIQIGPIKEPEIGQSDAFKEMITEDVAAKEPGIIYSDESLSALCVYSARVPLYAKEICNTVLDHIRNIGISSFGRNVIYTYDVSEAVNFLLKEQINGLTHEKCNEFNTAQIVQIFDAVTKGLDDNTDKQYLWYIADWFIKNPTKDKFPYSEFAETETRYLIYGENSLIDSLIISKERGIICGDKHSGYVFSTIFYHNAFCGTVNNTKGNRPADKIFALKELSEPAYSSDTYSKQFDLLIDQMTLEEKKSKLWDMYNIISDDDKSYPGNLRNKISGNNMTIHTGSYNNGNIGTQNIVQINIQSMANAFNTLLNGDVTSTEYLKAFDQLPTLKMFIEEDKWTKLEVNLKTYMNSSDEAKQQVAIEEIESITKRAEQSLIGTTVAAVMASEDFFNVTAERWLELIHISKSELSKTLKSEVITPLSFAVMLHNVFAAIEKKAKLSSIANNKVENELDYCPVAIMYCKIVEAMLKDLHTPIYVERLGEYTLKKGTKFKTLKLSDGTINKSSKDLTIGSFAFNIVKPANNDVNNNIDHPDIFSYVEKRNEIKKITDDNDDYSNDNVEWYRHAKQLAVIQGIRNKSAHETRPITKSNFNWLIKTLFDEGELMRIVSIEQKWVKKDDLT